MTWELVAETCQRIVVMYASKVLEIAPVRDLFASPAHPYTQGLLRSVPRMDTEVEPAVLPGYVPSALNRPAGCPFHVRCQAGQGHLPRSRARYGAVECHAFGRMSFRPDGG